MQPFVKIYDNPQLLAHSLSLEIAHRSAFSKKHRQSLNLALSGGTTPTLLIETMAQSLYNTQIHWKNIRFFWGDERCVPPQDPQAALQHPAHDHCRAPGAGDRRGDPAGAR